MQEALRLETKAGVASIFGSKKMFVFPSFLLKIFFTFDSHASKKILVISVTLLSPNLSSQIMLQKIWQLSGNFMASYLQFFGNFPATFWHLSSNFLKTFLQLSGNFQETFWQLLPNFWATFGQSNYLETCWKLSGKVMANSNSSNNSDSSDRN